MLKELLQLMELVFLWAFAMGALGLFVDKLAKCKWVGKAVERMVKE